MKYKALTSFSGVFSMYKDEIRELTDPELIKDLTKAGYIMPFVKAFLTLKRNKDKTLAVAEAEGFSLIEGNGWDGLKNIKNGEYYLFGKNIKIQDGIFPDEEYSQMLEYIKKELFDLYVAIWKQKIEMEKKNETIGKLVELLTSNYNLIFTGAPGTGKTYLAQQIAKEMVILTYGKKTQCKCAKSTR